MAREPIQELAAYWIAANGSTDNVVTAVSVALAESGGDPDAVSPTQDYGLWQINILNLRAMNISVTQARIPAISAIIAVRMSDHGTNWGPWCTAWVQPVGNCGTYLGPQVQAGSPASTFLPSVGGALGLTAGMSPNAPPPTVAGDAQQRTDLHNAWGALQAFTSSYAPSRGNTLAGYIRQIVEAIKG